jgi:lysophosphatidylcholine acyltransferase/lyso-PAF acetyltransferase
MYLCVLLRVVLLLPGQGTTTNGVCLLPFKTGAFLAGAPVQPVILRYGENRISPAWDSIGALWHTVLLLANPTHSVTARQVLLLLHVILLTERRPPQH